LSGTLLRKPRRATRQRCAADPGSIVSARRYMGPGCIASLHAAPLPESRDEAGEV